MLAIFDFARRTILPKTMLHVEMGKGAEITAEYLSSASDTSRTERVARRQSTPFYLLYFVYAWTSYATIRFTSNTTFSTTNDKKYTQTRTFPQTQVWSSTPQFPLKIVVLKRVNAARRKLLNSLYSRKMTIPMIEYMKSTAKQKKQKVSNSRIKSYTIEYMVPVV